jgi:glycosyltransferase involved in cell wall biosynthesis
MNEGNATIEIADWEKLPNKPSVSVYMLAYRHEEFIAQAVEGVIAQQCEFPIELIIGEDCSPDRTREIVLDYQRRYPHLIRVLTSEKNIGARANTRRCQSATRGKYVAICEGDDYWHHPGKLQMQVDAMARTPAATLVHTDFDRRVGDRILRNWNRRNSGPDLAQGEAFEALLRRMSVATATAMYKRAILMDYAVAGPDDSPWPFGDYPRALYASLHGSVIYLAISTATYRYVAGSVMNRGAQNLLVLQRAGLECREHFMTMRACSTDVQREVRRISHRAIMRQSLLCGDKDAYLTECGQLSLLKDAPSTLEYLVAIALINAPVLRKIYLGLLRIWHKIKFFVRSRRVNESPHD